MVFDDIDYRFRDYDPFGAYGQSKTANVLFAVEATRRWASDGIVANALMPGGIATPLQRHLPAHYAADALEAFRAAGTDFKTVEQGAATSVLLAASPSELPIMRQAGLILEKFDIPHEVRIMSSSRNPDLVDEYAVLDDSLR